MKIEEILVKRGYTMNKCGECFNPKGEKIYGSVSSSGYLCSAVRINKKHTRFRFHRFMGYLKFGEEIYKSGIQVRHLDGNSLNNSWDNIDIGTQSENMHDIPKERRIECALKATQRVKRYSDKDVLEMKMLRDNGAKYSEIMELFNISSKGTLSFILNNRYCLTH